MNYNNIPESLKLLDDCLCKAYDSTKFNYKEWDEMCNALDYLAFKLGYKQAFESKKGYEKIIVRDGQDWCEEYPKNQRGNA